MKVITLPALAIALLLPLAAMAAELTPEDAAKHVGENATVCGTVASAHYAPRTRSQPTFLNLDKPYPNQIFTAVIFGSDRAKFGEPETTLQGKRICVTGTIRLYRGKPEIILNDPKQLESSP
jgi:DNA/RNA endonuclease YhcR with UshA esterase domain